MRNHLIKIILSLSLFTSSIIFAQSVDFNFPYGAPPSGKQCAPPPTDTQYYATPESMLGSWAMLNAVNIDQNSKQLPDIFNKTVVYGVGTAAIGIKLGVPNCAPGGCDQINGYCFAMRFDSQSKDHPPPQYKYMVFQSVNIAGQENQFDIYMAGGGSGAWPKFCPAFWGGTEQDWSKYINNDHPDSCKKYFNSYLDIQSQYSVTYNGISHPAKETLSNACTFAENAGFQYNLSNIKIVPVTCPASLTQITGLRILPTYESKIGNYPIKTLNTLVDADFDKATITISTTEMEDCKTPSSGYCGISSDLPNIAKSVTNYQASISATLTAPAFYAPPKGICNQFPEGYCSWNIGIDGQGGPSSYCGKSKSACELCGGRKWWCSCSGGVLSGCELLQSQ